MNFIAQNRSIWELFAAKEELYDQGKEGIFEENKMKQWAVNRGNFEFFTLALIFVSNLDTEQNKTWHGIHLDPKRAIRRKQTDERQLFNALVSPLTTLPSNYSQNVVQKLSPIDDIDINSGSRMDPPPWVDH